MHSACPQRIRDRGQTPSPRICSVPWSCDVRDLCLHPRLERDPDTATDVGYVPAWPGAHSQGDALDELQINLQEVLAMLLEEADPRLESEFVEVETIKVT